MKKILFSIAILSIAFACNSTSTQDAAVVQETNDTTTTTTLNTDTVSDVKPTGESLAKYFSRDGDGDWVQAKNTSDADIYVYFQAPLDVARNLRLRLQFSGISNYKLVVDGKQYTYKANRSKDTDSRFVDGAVNWYDNSVKREDLKFLEALVSSKSAYLALSEGKTINIGNDIKQSIKRTLDYYEALDGLLPKSNMVNIRRI